MCVCAYGSVAYGSVAYGSVAYGSVAYGSVAAYGRFERDSPVDVTGGGWGMALVGTSVHLL